MPNDSGIGPVNLFLSNRKNSKYGSCDSEAGIVPTSLLYDRLMYVKLFNRLRTSGTGPEMSDSLILKKMRFVSLTIVDGIGPVRLRTLWILNFVRYVRSPMAGERYPERFILEKSMRLIRFDFSSHSRVGPYQSMQQSVLGFQLPKSSGLPRAFFEF